MITAQTQHYSTAMTHAASSNDNINPQPTGQSNTTIDAAYDGVCSQLDALANQGMPSTALAFSAPPPHTASSSTPLAPAIPISITTPPFVSQPPIIPPRPRDTGFMDDVSRLETVTERTEVSSLSQSTRDSPRPQEVITTTVHTQRVDPERGSSIDTLSIQSIANRFPLPTSPMKGPRPAVPQTSPKKASDLIRLFESRAGGPSDPPAPPLFPSISAQNTGRSIREANPPISIPTPNLQSIFTASVPPSSYHTPIIHPTPPPKSPSPLSQVRTMIASWRARSGSPSQRVVGSPNRGGDTPRLFGRDRGWNVSIRRRKRHEGLEETALAEQGVEEVVGQMIGRADSVRIPSERGSVRGVGEEGGAGSRSGSIRSQALSIRPTEPPRTMTGEVSLMLQ
jgi:hypothetical protein